MSPTVYDLQTLAFSDGTHAEHQQRADGNQVEATLQFTGSPGTIADILLISAEHISKECLQPEFEVVTLCECI